uniref:Uncharacterized protein n=1 Tax=Cynoglossus semilaevis TaxID=244447 RepID=A0A3P8W0B0_CYNSE
ADSFSLAITLITSFCCSVKQISIPFRGCRQGMQMFLFSLHIRRQNRTIGQMCFYCRGSYHAKAPPKQH